MQQPDNQRSSQLHFSHDELQPNTIKKPAAKAKQKALQSKQNVKKKAEGVAKAKQEPTARILDSAKEKTVKANAEMKETSLPTSDKKPISSRLQFGEMPSAKKKSTSSKEKKSGVISAKPLQRAIKAETDQQLYQNEKEYTGLQAAHASQQAGTSALHTGKRLHEMRQDRLQHTSEKKTSALNLDNLMKGSYKEKPAGTSGSNPMSKQYQRASIKNEYRASKAGKKSGKAAGKATRGAAEKASSVSEKAVEYVSRRKHYILLLLLGGMLLLIMQGVAACAPLLQAGMMSATAGTYPAKEEDIYAAEQYYANKENRLRDEMENYAAYHPEYDECIVEAQEIWHDPYALISLISAYKNGEEWTIDDAIPVMNMLFEWQYERSDTSSSTLKYHTEIIDGKETKVWHTVTTCQVTLKNRNLSHAPVYVMSTEKVGLYALYMSTHGNVDGMFYGPHVSVLEDPLVYDVPQDLLNADPKFALLVEEANKRLGYPYVWGGHTPETSFDCSGFISWIFTETGVRNIGHMGATGLYGISRKINESDLKPGDVIFFSGTIEGESGITHCGLYVGNGMMIHSGSPCSYYDIAHGSLKNNIAGYGRMYEH